MELVNSIQGVVHMVSVIGQLVIYIGLGVMAFFIGLGLYKATQQSTTKRRW